MNDIFDGQDENRRALTREYSSKSYENQIAYGRWVLASLVAIHGGAIIAIVQSEKLAIPLLKESGLSLVVGLLAAVLSGAIAYVNFSLSNTAYLALSLGLEPKRHQFVGVGVTNIIAALLTFASIVAFGWAAYQALDVISVQPA